MCVVRVGIGVLNLFYLYCSIEQYDKVVGNLGSLCVRENT